MKVLDELSLRVNRIFVDSMSLEERSIILAVQMLIEEFSSEHPGLEDHTKRCVICGGPMKLSGNTLVFTNERGGTIGWQHSGCLGKPACAKEGS